MAALRTIATCFAVANAAPSLRGRAGGSFNACTTDPGICANLGVSLEVAGKVYCCPNGGGTHVNPITGNCTCNHAKGVALAQVGSSPVALAQVGSSEKGGSFNACTTDPSICDNVGDVIKLLGKVYCCPNGGNPTYKTGNNCTCDSAEHVEPGVGAVTHTRVESNEDHSFNACTTDPVICDNVGDVIKLLGKVYCCPNGGNPNYKTGNNCTCDSAERVEPSVGAVTHTRVESNEDHSFNACTTDSGICDNVDNVIRLLGKVYCCPNGGDPNYKTGNNCTCDSAEGVALAQVGSSLVALAQVGSSEKCAADWTTCSVNGSCCPNGGTMNNNNGDCTCNHAEGVEPRCIGAGQTCRDTSSCCGSLQCHAVRGVPGSHPKCHAY